MVYAVGQANFLFDSSRLPTATPDQLSVAFGLAKGTMGSKAKQVRDLLRISPFEPEFLRSDVVAENPMAWLVQVDGLVYDARRLSLDLQTAAFRCGIIPYIPAIGPDGTADFATASGARR